MEPETEQGRIDRATPPVGAGLVLRQSFRCSRPNLCEIELLPAVYEAGVSSELHLSLRSLDDGSVIAQRDIDAEIQHNQPLVFAFPVQHDSATKTYELEISADRNTGAGFWYSSLDAYGSGSLWIDGADSGGDLRFTTRCLYAPSDLVRELGRTWERLNADALTPWRVPAALVAILILPGYLIWHGLGLNTGRDGVTNLGFSVALSLAVAPLVLLWSTVAGLAWQASACRLAYVMLALAALVRICRTHGQDLVSAFSRHSRASVAAMCALLTLTLSLRLLHVRDLLVPAWVDSPQHALVTELLTIHGQVPSSYQPLLDVQRFVYHFGFHANAAAFHSLSTLPIPAAILLLGQMLNGAAVLMAYLFVLRLSQRRVAAIAAAILTGVVSYMPAYYVSWGRYTQLTGLLLLPAALVVTLDWLEVGRRDWRLLLAAGALWGGLAVTHARVIVFGVCFVAAILLLESWNRYRAAGPTAWELWRRLAFLGFASLAVAGPWIQRVAAGILKAIQETGQGPTADATYNALSAALLLAPRNRELMILATVGALWGVCRRRRESAWLILWMVLVALVTNPGWLGLPGSNFLNNSTAAIALYVPLTALGGQAVVALWEIGRLLSARCGSTWGRVWRGTAATILGIVALAGAWGMVSIVNPTTVLVTPADMQAMAWIRENTPADALFLINVRPWQLGIYVGVDGGYWIRRLTGRQTLLPELPYVYGRPDDVRRITEAARTVSETTSGAESELMDVIREWAATHIYTGAKGGALTPQMFLDAGPYRPVYSSGEVWIFEVEGSRP